MRRYLLFIILLFLLAACQSENNNQIRPIRATPTPGTLYFSAVAKPVTFEEVAATPNQFLNQNIRVSGSFSALPKINCQPYRGPRISWALIDSGLQMNAVGFEKVVPLLPEDYPMTVEGIWRLYRGPLGCGKEPASDALWYLDVHKIVQPNPISIALNGGLVVAEESGGVVIQPTLPPVAPPVEAPTSTATPTPTPTTTMTPTATSTVTATVTSTPTPTATLTVSATQTVTGSVTPTPGTPTPGNTPTVTGTPDPSTTQTVPPPIGTATPDPDGDNTPAPYPNPTTDPYP